MNAVIDASIAAALLVELSYSDAAREAVSNVQSALVPDLIIYEITNTFWKMIKAEDAAEPQMQEALDYLPRLFDEIIPAHDLARDALSLAIQLKHPAYDCFYLALARQRDATLITADRRLVRALENSKSAIGLKFIVS